MNEKQLDNGLLIKYLRYIIDFATRLLSSPETLENEFEDICKEYALFQSRLNSSTKIDKKLVEIILNLNLLDKNESKNIDEIPNNIFACMLPAFFRSASSNAARLHQTERLTNVKNSLSHILFVIEQPLTDDEVQA
jgi:hypothetical protein